MKKWTVVIAVSAVLIVSGGVAAYFYSSGPNPAKMTTDQIMKYVRTDDFNSLPREAKGQFFRQVMDNRVNTYSSLSPEEKPKYLDKIIDEMSSMRSQTRAQNRNFGERQRFDPNRRPDPNTFRNSRNMKPADRRARREQRDPEQGARARIFFNDLRARMQERGIAPMGPPMGRGRPMGPPQ
ncbi:MAG: hypothetical protein NTW55_03440 [Planctomycetota bacterium]|nr:hypothetical protein [Planctomycetota bacterium]